MIRLLSLLLTFTLAVPALTCSPAMAGEEDWASFLESPGEASYIECSKDIVRAIWGEKSRERGIAGSTAYLALKKEGAFERLLALVDSGDVYARHLAFEVYPLFKGKPRALRSLNVTLGKLVKANPEYFLIILKANQERKGGEHYERILDTYGEGAAGELRETEERLKALKKVKNKDLEGLRDKWIKKLTDKKEALGKKRVD